MKQFIQLKLPDHPITIPTSAIVFLRPFFKSDVPTTGLLPNYFEHDGSRYNSENRIQTQDGKTITINEYYEARREYEKAEQEKINEKYSQVKAVVYVRLMGNSETQKELVEDSYEELSAALCKQ
jgi:hypothetical protein